MRDYVRRLHSPDMTPLSYNDEIDPTLTRADGTRERRVTEGLDAAELPSG